MKLIDVDAAIHALNVASRGDSKDVIRNLVIRFLLALPTVDAEPVIRCKDCKHWLPHTQFGYDADNEKYHNYCERHLPDDDFYAFIKEAEDYCSWAERKEE